MDFVRAGYFIPLKGPLNRHPPSVVLLSYSILFSYFIDSNFMFKTVLKNAVCIYHYMGKNKIDSDSDSDSLDAEQNA